MADKEFTVRATRAAATAIDGLRGRARKSYEAFEAELRKQGCKVPKEPPATTTEPHPTSQQQPPLRHIALARERHTRRPLANRI